MVTGTLALLGAAAIAAGSALIYLPAGVIVAGIMLLGAAGAYERGQEPPSSPDGEQ